MSITLRILGKICIIDDGVWASEDRRLEKLLNINEVLFRQYQDLGNDPDQDSTSAAHAMHILGGKIIDLQYHEVPEFDLEAVY